MAGKRETANAALKTVFVAGLPGWTVIRVSFDLDLDRHVPVEQWPTTGAPLLALIEGDGSGDAKEKSSNVQVQTSILILKLWVFDRTSLESLCTTFNAALAQVQAICRTVNGATPGASWSAAGFVFQMSDWAMMRGKENLPPYAGASARATATYRE